MLGEKPHVVEYRGRCVLGQHPQWWGVGIGCSQHAGMVVVADGTSEAALRLERVLTKDPVMGVLRHADAGYPQALSFARTSGLRLPMAEGE